MIRVASLRTAETGRPDRMAEVEIVNPGPSYAVVSDAGGLWILPEPWKTPSRPENDRRAAPAFPTAPWTAQTPPTGSTGPTTALPLQPTEPDRMAPRTGAEMEGGYREDVAPLR